VERILEAPPVYPTDALAEILLEPALAGPLPAAVEPGPRQAVFLSSGLAVVGYRDFAATVFGGTDYVGGGRIRSGLASNPTFLRVFAGAAVLDSMRLSRYFFGIGPFRADDFEFDSDQFILTERVSASYYQPLPAIHYRPDGAYRLSDEGRFSASMDFAHRPADEVALTTEIRARVLVSEGEVRLWIRTDPGRVRQVLELAFRDGGDLEGVRPLESGGFEPESGDFAYRVGDDRITVSVDALGRNTKRAGYHPGEDYTHMAGTDAAGGVRVYVPLPETGRATMTVRAEHTGAGAE
jgi:hypothetical protein